MNTFAYRPAPEHGVERHCGRFRQIVVIEQIDERPHRCQISKQTESSTASPIRGLFPESAQQHTHRRGVPTDREHASRPGMVSGGRIDR